MTRIAFRAACLVLALVVPAGPIHAQQSPYSDRFVWVFGWSLQRDGDLEAIEAVLHQAGRHGYNGAVVSLGLDRLCRYDAAFFQRLEKLKTVCRDEGLELIPAVFSIGYGGWALSHNRYLAEGLPVVEAPFEVFGRDARFVSSPDPLLRNGGFEKFSGNRLSEYRFHDEPGEVSFIDRETRHGGQVSLRMEQFQPPHGHGRVMQEVAVVPHRCYRITLWVKTENLDPADAFRIQVLAGNRSLAPQRFDLPPTTPWRKVTMLFNSLDFDRVRLYAGVWGGRSGRFWIDDWSLEEVGPLNVLRRPGTPVRVADESGTILYEEGRDYEPLVDQHYSPYRIDRPAPALKLTAGSRIHDGQRLRVSWYHAMAINGSQITVCMAEPELYELIDHEAALLAKHLRPNRVFLNMDEVRMGGTCEACRGRNMGELLGKCITRQTEILKKYLPDVQVYAWSDMLDPNHNAHGDYYLVKGDFTGSWNHVPNDLMIAVWGGQPRPQSLRFFADHGFQILIAGYYDADDLSGVRGWLDAAKGIRQVRGFMYTPWQKKYGLLGDVGELLTHQRGE